MASVDILTLSDGTATPVYFQPRSVNPPTYDHVPDGVTESIGWNKLVYDVSPPSSKRPTGRITVRFAMPQTYVDADTGVRKVSGVARFNGTVIIPDNMALVNRQAFQEIIASFFQDSAMTVAFGEFEKAF